MGNQSGLLIGVLADTRTKFFGCRDDEVFNLRHMWEQRGSS